MHAWNEFQIEAMRTCPAMSIEDMIMHAKMGMVGETGEVVDALKKWRFQSTKDAPMPKGKIVEECGDILWYCAEICTAMDYKLSEMAKHGATVRADFVSADICDQALQVAKLAMLKNISEPFGLFPQLPRLMMHIDVMLQGIGSDIDEAMRMVVDKLRMRYPDGFDPQRSMEREKHNDCERVAEQYRSIGS